MRVGEPFVTWSQLFSVGVPELDEEHRQLVSLINWFHERQVTGAGRDAIFEVLNELVRYAEYHFAHEERLLEALRFPERLKHKIEHDRFLQEVFRLNGRLAAGDESVSTELMDFLKSWLLNDVLNADKKYERFIADRWPA
jgi:hemerythrin-like metal-binding protein